MRSRLRCVLLLLVMSLLITPIAQNSSASPVQAQLARPEQTPPPLMFVENVGQFDPGARFVLPGASTTLFLAEDALWLTALEHDSSSSESATRGVNLRLSFVGAAPHSRLEPFGRLDTAISYISGDAAQARYANVPVWAGVRYVNLYPDIDLELTGGAGQLAPRLVARPGADLGAVRMEVHGADQLSIAGERMRLATGIGTLSLPLFKAVVAGGEIREHGLRPELQGIGIRAPFLSSSARSAPAPQSENDLVYSTFLGGSGVDFGTAITADISGTIYVAGNTESINFPTTPGAFTLNACGCRDGFVAKFRPGESSLIFATFLGGENDENLTGIAIDGDGNSYVTGYTVSDSFPTTTSPIGNNLEPANAFVAKLNASGTELIYSRLLGGSGEDRGLAIAVDAQGAAYITGSTNSENVISTFGDTFGGGTCFYTQDRSDLRVCYDAFVVKLDPSGSALVYSRLLGGDGDENQHNRVGIAVDASGAAYITGSTSSYGQTPFPTTPGALQTDYGPTPGNGNRFNAFAVKLNPNGSTAYSTYLGGSSYDAGHDIAVDATGAAYIVSKTSSADALFPITTTPADPDYNGGWDAFVVKLDPTGSSASYATWLGGAQDECPTTCGIAVAQNGVVFVGGGTQSAQFPTTAGAYNQEFNGGSCDTGGCTDAFVVRLSANGAAIEYGTFAGGAGEDYARDIALGANEQVYITGYTDSPDFPTTADALYQAIDDGPGDSFVLGLVTSTTFTLSGSTRRVGGAPVAGVMIFDNAGHTTTTGSDGSFTLRGLPPGTYIVRAAKTGYRVAPAQQTITVPGTNSAQTFIVEPGGAYLPVIVRSPPPPPDIIIPPCDAFEPNNNRRATPAGPLLSGQEIQAKICAFEGADTPLLGPEDNYWFETTSSAPVVVTVGLPPALLAGESSAIMLYSLGNLAKPLPNCYISKITGRPFTMTCPIASAGKFVVRLYTNLKQTDEVNPYTLRVEYQ